jgi:hypothetical protein
LHQDKRKENRVPEKLPAQADHIPAPLKPLKSIAAEGSGEYPTHSQEDVRRILPDEHLLATRSAAFLPTQKTFPAAGCHEKGLLYFVPKTGYLTTRY